MFNDIYRYNDTLPVAVCPWVCLFGTKSHMAGFSQTQHFFAAARLFGVFGSIRVSIGSSRIFMGSRIFLFEVWSHSDFQ